MVGRIFGSGISVCTEPSSFFSLVSYGIENQLYIQTESRKWTILASREAQLLTNFILDLILSLSLQMWDPCRRARTNMTPSKGYSNIFGATIVKQIECECCVASEVCAIITS